MTKEQKEKALAFLKDMQECTYDGVEEIRTAIEALKQEPRKEEVILTKEEYGELVSSEFDNGYAKGYREALEEQEPILDKIRAEIEALEYLNIEDGSDGFDKYIEQYEVLKIIDKYKTKSEGEE